MPIYPATIDIFVSELKIIPAVAPMTPDVMIEVMVYDQIIFLFVRIAFTKPTQARAIPPIRPRRAFSQIILL